MRAFDADPDVGALYERFTAVLDPATCFRGEFELAAGRFGLPEPEVSA